MMKSKAHRWLDSKEVDGLPEAARDEAGVILTLYLALIREEFAEEDAIRLTCAWLVGRPK